jgi:hypothetical protein
MNVYLVFKNALEYDEVLIGVMDSKERAEFCVAKYIEKEKEKNSLYHGDDLIAFYRSVYEYVSFYVVQYEINGSQQSHALIDRKTIEEMLK